LKKLSELLAESVLWRSKPTPSQIWLKRLKRVGWLSTLCGRMLKPSLIGRLTDVMMSSQRAFLASRSVVLERALQRLIQDTCGRSLQAAFDCADLPLFSLKTCRASLPQNVSTERRYCCMSSEIWKREVTQRRGDCIRRRKSALRINASGSSFSAWRTPNSSDGEGGFMDNLNAQGKNGHYKLRDQGNWATPNTCDATRGTSETYIQKKRRGAHTGESLIDMVNWPTPRSSEWKGTGPKGSRSQLTMKKKHYLCAVVEDGRHDPDASNLTGKSRGQLNPDWVEQLMGWPVGWTAFDLQATE
jgi:hypothetical protein